MPCNAPGGWARWPSCCVGGSKPLHTDMVGTVFKEETQLHKHTMYKGGKWGLQRVKPHSVYQQKFQTVIWTTGPSDEKERQHIHENFNLSRSHTSLWQAAFNYTCMCYLSYSSDFANEAFWLMLTFKKASLFYFFNCLVVFHCPAKTEKKYLKSNSRFLLYSNTTKSNKKNREMANWIQLYYSLHHLQLVPFVFG